jgi:hypothetical protein
MNITHLGASSVVVGFEQAVRFPYPGVLIVMERRKPGLGIHDENRGRVLLRGAQVASSTLGGRRKDI